MIDPTDMGAKRGAELRELVELEVTDIVAVANEQGFSSEETLAAISQAVSAATDSLNLDPDPAEDPAEPPAGPHARRELVDNEKTPNTGALPEIRSGEVDPGVG